MSKRHEYREKASIERVRELFIYNPETGEFFWTDRCAKNVRPGKRAGFKDTLGYWGITIDSVIYKAHRVAWAYVHGKWPTMDIDHIDGQRSNNSIQNLRQVTNRQNQANRKSAFGKSTYKGVCFHKRHKKWMAQLKTNGETKFIGYFDSQEEAALAYNKRALLVNGEFASINVITDPEEEEHIPTHAEQSFERYMDEVIQWAGQTGKRRLIWSIPRCTLAREVWMECMERQNDARSRECVEVSGPQVSS